MITQLYDTSDYANCIECHATILASNLIHGLCSSCAHNDWTTRHSHE